MNCSSPWQHRGSTAALPSGPARTKSNFRILAAIRGRPGHWGRVPRRSGKNATPPSAIMPGGVVLCPDSAIPRLRSKLHHTHCNRLFKIAHFRGGQARRRTFFISAGTKSLSSILNNYSGTKFPLASRLVVSRARGKSCPSYLRSWSLKTSTHCRV